jgi:hypothetical protein
MSALRACLDIGSGSDMSAENTLPYIQQSCNKLASTYYLLEQLDWVVQHCPVVSLESLADRNIGRCGILARTMLYRSGRLQNLARPFTSIRFIRVGISSIRGF